MNMPATESGGGHVSFSRHSARPWLDHPVAPLAPTIRLRLDIAYDGTDFAGWATQTGQRTVAGVIDEALTTVFRTPIVTRAAGRTDTGVHATGQVAHVDIPADAVPLAYPRHWRTGGQGPDVAAGADPEFLPLVRRLAKLLTDDVRILDIRRAPEGFDARFSALRRHYTYRLSSAPYGVAPAEARFVTPWGRPLDLEAIRAASQELLGLNDFAAFCRPREGATTIRDLQRLDWERDGHAITAYVTADAFCWSMVRSLVGALLAVGEGRLDPAFCAGLLEQTSRSSAFAVAPARGLTLVGVDYPPDDELAARIAVTRDLRTADEVER